MNGTTFSILFFLFTAALLSNCNSSTPSPPGTGVRVTREPTLTKLNGDWVTQELKGLKRVRINVFFETGAAYIPDGVQVTSWIPAQPGISERPEKTVAAQLEEGSTTRFIANLDDSDDLDICERIMYRWTIIYKDERLNNNGLYMGAEEYETPTMSYGPGNTIQQALCAF